MGAATKAKGKAAGEDEPDAKAEKARAAKEAADAEAQARAQALLALNPLRVVLDREVFAERLGMVCAVVPTKAPREVYTLLLIEAVDAMHGGPCVRVTGQNGEVAIVATMEEVDVQVEGRALVSAARLRAMIGEMTCPRATLTLEPQKGNLRIEDEGARFVLRADDPDLYPASPPKGETVLRLPSACIAAALDRVAFAAHTERTRYSMNGVSFEVDPVKGPGRLSIVATDGKRASWCEIEAPDAKAEMAVVIPSLAIAALGRILARWPDEQVEMAPVAMEEGVNTVTAMQLRTSRACVTARLVEGHFPPWRDLPMWNEAWVGTLEINRAALNQAIRAVAVVADKITNVSRWTITREGLKMGLRQTDTGDAAEVDVPGTFDGSDVSTGYCSSYVADALKHVGDVVRLGFAKAHGAHALRIDGEVPGAPQGARATWRYMVMPVNVTA